MRTAILVVLAVLAALAVGWYAGANRFGWPKVTSIPADYVPAVAKAPVVASPVASSSVDAELEELVRPRTVAVEGPTETIDPSTNRKGQRVAALDATVADGGTLLTDPYEVTPGVFNFSSLTPRIAATEDGAPEIRMDVKRFQFDVGGSYYLDFNDTILVRPDGSSGISFQEGDQGFASVLRVELQPDSNQIRVMARDYKTNDPPPPATLAPAPDEVP
ncbi:MAG: hypothetical protein ACAI34_24310 [Verrucomicrobium sp.]